MYIPYGFNLESPLTKIFTAIRIYDITWTALAPHRAVCAWNTCVLQLIWEPDATLLIGVWAFCDLLYHLIDLEDINYLPDVLILLIAAQGRLDKEFQISKGSLSILFQIMLDLLKDDAEGIFRKSLLGDEATSHLR